MNNPTHWRALSAVGALMLTALSACVSVGGSQAPSDIQRTTTEMILGVDRVLDKKCNARKIIDAKPEDSYSHGEGKRVGWYETWQLDRCGKTIPYRVKYERRFVAARFHIDIRPQDEQVTNLQYIELLALRHQCEPVGDATLISQEGNLVKYRMGCKNGDMTFQCNAAPQTIYFPATPCKRLESDAP